MFVAKINHKKVLKSLHSSYNASLVYSGTSKRLTQGVIEACVTEPLS